MAINSLDFDYIRTLVRKRSAIVIDEEKNYLVELRLSAYARREGYISLEAMLAKLRSKSSGALEDKIVEVMTNNETSFFRDAAPFGTLHQVVLHDLMERRARERRLFIWCGACSSGQEPYSVAMLLREHFPELVSWDVRILATDLSVDMIERARQGRYNQIEINRGMPAALLAKYFDRGEPDWQIKDEIRQMVEFRQVNLIGAWPAMPPADVVILRNVLIYFDVETKKDILTRIRHMTQPDGYLFLGGAETTINLSDSFDRVDSSGSGCYRLRIPNSGRS